MLLAEERITFSWSNLCVEVPGGSKRRFCGILPSKGDPKPPKQILRNGKIQIIWLVSIVSKKHFFYFLFS